MYLALQVERYFVYLAICKINKMKNKKKIAQQNQKHHFLINLLINLKLQNQRLLIKHKVRIKNNGQDLKKIEKWVIQNLLKYIHLLLRQQLKLVIILNLLNQKLNLIKTLLILSQIHQKLKSTKVQLKRKQILNHNHNPNYMINKMTNKNQINKINKINQIIYLISFLTFSWTPLRHKNREKQKCQVSFRLKLF